MRLAVPAVLVLGTVTTVSGVVLASSLITVIGAAVLVVGLVVAAAGRTHRRNR